MANEQLPADASNADDAAPFFPIIARAIELGRGPAGLVRWLREHGLPATSGAQRELVVDLARELARALRSAIGEQATQRCPALKTVADHPPATQ
jgi:hypothetical protein